MTIREETTQQKNQLGGKEHQEDCEELKSSNDKMETNSKGEWELILEDSYEHGEKIWNTFLLFLISLH